MFARRALSVAASVVMLAAFAVPAHAQLPPGCSPPVPGQTTSCTVHVTDRVLPPHPVFPILCPDGSTVPGGILAATIENGVFHITVNGAGDEWVTSTIEGTFVFTAAPSGTVYTGHFVSWFGGEFNNQNTVLNFTASYVGMSAAGSTISLHFQGHMRISTDGQLSVDFDVVC